MIKLVQKLILDVILVVCFLSILDKDTVFFISFKTSSGKGLGTSCLELYYSKGFIISFSYSRKCSTYLKLSELTGFFLNFCCLDTELKSQCEKVLCAVMFLLPLLCLHCSTGRHSPDMMVCFCHACFF